MKDEGAEPYPSKRLGQHFLRDQRIIHRIIEALAPKADETIVEIGPGTVGTTLKTSLAASVNESIVPEVKNGERSTVDVTMV